MIGRSFATPWYRSRAVSVSSRKSSWMKGFMSGLAQAVFSAGIGSNFGASTWWIAKETR